MDHSPHVVTRADLRYLLLQVRKPEDPMRDHEIACFARELMCPTENIGRHDLISGPPAPSQINSVDAVLVGGSGDFSVAEGGFWLDDALATFVELYDASKPTFASCWGFQAFARALGGEVVTDLRRAELGTHELYATDAAAGDPVFRLLGRQFLAQLGHQDIVDSLPVGATRMAYSSRVENEAFAYPDRLIYATQFHPELTREDLLMRCRAYPQYIRNITGWTLEEFETHCRPTPLTSQLLGRFADLLVARRMESSSISN